MFQILFGLFGLAVLLGIAWAFSANRRAVDWKLVGIGVVLQLVFACLVLLTPFGAKAFGALSQGFIALLGFTQQGANFIFGPFAQPELVGTAIASGQGETAPGAWQAYGFIFAFQVLPTIIFFASLMSVLYHVGVMQKIVEAMAWVIRKVMRVSGAETLATCANCFIGQTESPLVIRPFVATMTRSELLTLMVGGMATIAGGVLGAYVAMLGGGDPERQAFFARHLITASIMAAPATLVVAKILMPETERPLTEGHVRVPIERTATNVIDAAAGGAADGLRLALNVGAMLLAFVALIALVDAPIGWLGQVTQLDTLIGRELSLSVILGYVLAPIAWVIGVPLDDSVAVGGLIGTKVVLNEFVAYADLQRIQATLSPQATLISTYALCGFANFSSIAIQIGGIGGIAPERRGELARLGLRAVLGGSIATLMTATIAGVLSQLAG
ncbi:NupC/NupG family nucleoside CNT transporter [Coralloluteibacterium stylophorae]|uniref:NupC/NupG family nucleoside CNT transporter n=1 Tax=Coralloluteibacterium stylophorae TaxID=1776034 RepID=A0A8J7VXW0_9GAMM|nr:nucleoside transporter C-terminal domain-containing protein [Coralloluteibacterium stylophorae]MBS7456047.1 NupC/NupG family nucleoside CNT transporter [Coralloluteibacterium stylophorae]